MDLSLFLQRAIDRSNLHIFSEFSTNNEHISIAWNDFSPKKLSNFDILPHSRDNATYYEIVNNNNQISTISTTYHAFINAKIYSVNLEDKNLKITTPTNKYSFDTSKYNNLKLVMKNESFYDLFIPFHPKTIKGKMRISIYLNNQKRIRADYRKPYFKPNVQNPILCSDCKFYSLSQYKIDGYIYTTGTTNQLVNIYVKVNDTTLFQEENLRPDRKFYYPFNLNISRIIESLQITSFPSKVNAKISVQQGGEFGSDYDFPFTIDSYMSNIIVRNDDKSINVSGLVKYLNPDTQYALDFFLDDSKVGTIHPFTNGNFSKKIQYPNNFQAGSHNIKLYIYLGDHYSVENIIEFGYSKNPPKLSIISPVSKIFIPENLDSKKISFTINYSVYEENTELYYKIDNGITEKKIEFNFQYNSPSTGSFELLIDNNLEIGNHTFNFYLMTSHKVRSEEIPYTFEIYDPNSLTLELKNLTSAKTKYRNNIDVITITGEVSMEFIASEVNVSLFVYENLRNSTILNTEPDKPSSFTLVYSNNEKDLKIGVNNVTIKATPSSGKEVSQIVSFEIEYNAPELNISDKNITKTITRSKNTYYNLSYNIYDADGPSNILIYYKIDNFDQVRQESIMSKDERPTSYDNELHIQIPYDLNQGEHNITIWASDSHYITDETIIQFIFFYQEPNLEVFVPEGELNYSFEVEFKLDPINNPTKAWLIYTIAGSLDSFLCNYSNISMNAVINLSNSLYGKQNITFQAYDGYRYSNVKWFNILVRYPSPMIRVESSCDLITQAKNQAYHVKYWYTSNITDDDRHNLTSYIDNQHSQFIGDFDGINLDAEISIPYDLSYDKHNISFVACNKHNRCSRSNYIYFYYQMPSPPTQFDFVYRIYRKGQVNI